MQAGFFCLVSKPRSPLNHPRGKGGLVTFLYLTEFQQHNLIGKMWQLSHLHLASLPQTTQLYSSHLYLAHLQFAEVPASNFKGSAFSRIHCNHQPVVWAVLFLPDPPFLFGGGSRYETSFCLHNFTTNHQIKDRTQLQCMVAKLCLYYPVTKRVGIQLYRIPATLLIRGGAGI